MLLTIGLTPAAPSDPRIRIRVFASECSSALAPLSVARRCSLRKSLWAGLLGAMLAGTLPAAEVHGTISENGKPLAQGVAVKLDCSGASASATTDQFGGYSLKANATGDCKLSVDYKGSSLSLPVTLYEKPSRYDLVVKTEGGKASLARK